MKLQLFIVGFAFLSSPLLLGKPISKRFGRVENGRTSEQVRNNLRNEVENSLQGMDQKRYEEIITDPQSARNEQESLVGLSAREIFILVDRSGSMDSRDDNPTGERASRWSRWNSAKIAAQSLTEVAFSLDTNGEVEVMLWSGDSYGRLNSEHRAVKTAYDIERLFEEYKPEGTTPLAKALEELQYRRLDDLLSKNEPFTCIVLTDGCPNEPGHVKKFFKELEAKHNLSQKGRETLAAFSFVRMGDDRSAIQFLQDLDDNLIREMNMRTDIVDTKEDNFLFGTGKYRGKSTVGPIALLWDAIYD